MREGWQIKTLGEVCVTIQDGAHESPKLQFDSPGHGRFPYVTSKNIRNNHLDLDKLSYVDEEFHNRIYPRCSPSLGDVLLTKDGINTGNVTLNTLDEPFSLLSSVCLIKTAPSLLLPSFLSYFIQSPGGLQRITGQMTGDAIKRIILRDIKLAEIPVPHSPNSSESSPCSTKRLRASPPPKPTPSGIFGTPVRFLRVIWNLSSVCGVRGGRRPDWKKYADSKTALRSRAAHLSLTVVQS